MTHTPPPRVERDSLGEIHVPHDALWGAQTQRATENFPISGCRLERRHIQALAWIKGMAARVNADLGVLDPAVALAVEAAAAQVAEGHHDGHFPVDVFQTGSGTSSNMNTNEVIANLATVHLRSGTPGSPVVVVHPNDHVNASQSSNDVFPSSIHLAALAGLVEDLLPALGHLATALERVSGELAQVVKAGRTHLMDATPVTLGQEFGGYAAQVRHGQERTHACLERLGELPLGGTAVGTGLNAPADFAPRVVALLRELTGLPVREARNHFEAQGARDALVEVSGQLRTVAVSLYKIANDIRWMGSGPAAGLRELRLPDLQPGSSIMPGKVNPVIPEAVRQVCAQVIGNDAAVAFAGSQGDFELNVMMPVMARNLLESVRLTTAVCRLLADRCVDGITADVPTCRRYAEASPAIVTPLTRYLGYDETAAVAHQALGQGRGIRETVVARGHVGAGRLTEAQLDEALDVDRMAHAGTAGRRHGSDDPREAPVPTEQPPAAGRRPAAGEPPA